MPPRDEKRRRYTFRKPQCEAGRITSEEGWRQLTAIQRRKWASDNEYRAALFIILRIAHTGKRWIDIGRRELARELGCSERTAYRVLDALVKGDILVRQPAEHVYNPYSGEYNADSYTFVAFAEAGNGESPSDQQ